MTIRLTPKYIRRSLRQVNYNIETALSEFVDNSIDAEASNIKILLPSRKLLEDGSIPITIEDNGKGISFEELENSFLFGSERNYADDEVGYYGIGMKSAIAYLSQFAIIETKTKDEDFMNIATWDIENEPMNIIFSKREVNSKDFKEGTKIILYTNHNNNNESSRSQYFTRTTPAYVMRRFSARYYHLLKNESVKLTINSDEIESFDPMYRNETEHKNFEDVDVIVDNKKFTVQLRGYYIGYVSEKGFDALSKKGKFALEHQGVYVLYCGKYINLGNSWLGCRTRHQALNAIRIEIELPKQITEYFGIAQNKNSSIDIKIEEDTYSRHTTLRRIADSLSKISTWGYALSVHQRKKEKTDVPVNSEELKELNKRLNKKQS